ncbi:NAD-dependent succinate-semialdehyde dehydrogenase [Neptunomonas antarctica]|uniref:Succinate semialdehyde dehydrogenase n=1 Tax=Neptunomonas antarctica TaxID=619304 RepID=A0A1N7L0N1_9GAMM|nr:NAD-dependent succinate-semialdehyde dehydrogenase [Neptunomonas antarctica]SIS67385.1 succinate semialdehyde dehydrogenase [Neptunomonas antarctica]
MQLTCSIIANKITNKKLLQTQAFIDGQWCEANSGQRFTVSNPANGAPLAEVSDLGTDEVLQAISAAERAWPNWRAHTGKERGAILRRWFELILAAKEDLAILMTAEQGKPLNEARGEVLYGASFVEWFAEEAKRLYGDIIPAHGRDKRLMVLKQPIGVAAAITPWNFPIAMITRKVAPALAAGCPVVIKPSELTPLSALALAKLAQEAGFPDGVFNVVTSTNAPEVGRILCADSRVRKLSFTGSTPVGKLLAQQCAANVKKVSLELGGNAPFIVFDDADLDAAVVGAMVSKFRNAGQTCVCTNRIFVQENVYEAFAEKFRVAVEALKTGNGADEGVEIGPLIDERALAKVESLVADALENGATLLTGGKRFSAVSNGYQPTVLSNVNNQMRIAQEEIFGPVATLIPFQSESEVIAMANDTPSGLAAYFYARDIGRVWRVSEALEYGMVGVNEGIISTEVAPFGGIKESGLGREGSKYGIDDYVELKYICLGLG